MWFLAAIGNATPKGESQFLLTQSSFVVIFPEARLGASVWKDLFRQALVREGATWPGAVCRLLRANWCRPWDRIKEELGGDPAESRRAFMPDNGGW